MIRATILASILLASTVASAWPVPPDLLPDPDQQPTPEPDPEPVPEPQPPTPQPTTLPTVGDDMLTLLDKIDELDGKVKALESSQRAAEITRQKVDKLEWLSHFINAYVDIGAFAVAGNGAGIRSDFLHQHYPQYRNTISGRWVFMGDPFTTSVNTLGEPAETGDSKEVAVDTLNSRGRPTMLVNSIGLDISKQVTDEFSFRTLTQFLPRPGPDQIEISYALVQYKPLPKRELYFEAGKIDSVLGIEYRNQDAPNRTEITPSLIARYTNGRPIGISARFNQHLEDSYHAYSLSGAILSGDNFEERFEPDTEIRSNKVPTVAGHAQWKFPIAQGLWLGVSGAIGPQDNQHDNHVRQWHYGFDLKLVDAGGLDVFAEYVQGHQPGKSSTDPVSDPMSLLERPTCDVADCLRYKGAYVLIRKRLLIDDESNERITPYVRFDWRDATHHRGAEFIYEANSIRGTVGVNVRIHKNVHAKLEYISNRELYVPNFPHDVITSSIVVSTE